MEFAVIALLGVAAVLFVWGRWMESRGRREPQRPQSKGPQGGGHLSTRKSTYQPTFEVPGSDAGGPNAEGQRASRTTPAPGYVFAGSLAGAGDAPARLVRDVATVLTAHRLSEMSGSQTLEEFTNTPLWTAIARSGRPSGGSGLR